MTAYRFAYSPCPNDTYIFAALTHGLVADAPAVKVLLEDIDDLNIHAQRGAYELSKVSYGAIPWLMDRYRILRSGGALGRGCGPLLVARADTGRTLKDFSGLRIAIPGERTTAFLLLQLALGLRPQTTVMRFDAIVDAVAKGHVDAGLIIHESRFTYAEQGLIAIADLGAWWESASGCPIPLGAIVVRDDVAVGQAARIDQAIRASLHFARNHEAQIMPYVRAHAFEMSDDVMRKHIELYVNDYSDDLGADGLAAVRELFARGRAAGIFEPHAEARML